ncbi:MAG TPA: cytochrome c [Candidatus Tumulicola sp.]
MRSIAIFTVGLVVALTVAGCAKSSSSTNASETAAAETAAAAGGPGEKVYATNCSSCHQADGKGLAGSFPPLAHNPTVTGDPTKVIRIVKFGLTGKIEVQGHAFNGIMPPWGSQLSNADIAAAVTYIRASFGNSAGAVTEAQVAAVAK